MQTITADLSRIPSPFSDGEPANRVETGALQINEDWPGVFIRGDNAIYHAMQLRQLLAKLEQTGDITDIFAISSVKSLIDTLQSCAIMHAQDDRQTSLELDTDGVGC